MVSQKRQKPRLSYQGDQTSQQRTVSALLNQLTKSQVQNLREAFSLLDDDVDGIVSRKDMEQILNSVGIQATEQQLDRYMEGYPEGIKFPSFLSIMADVITGLETRQEVYDAFSAFREKEPNGSDLTVPKHELYELLEREGYTRKELDKIFSKYLKGDEILAERFVDYVTDS